MSQTLFTADSHFGHTGIIGMCDRPYVGIEEHDRGLIEAWNAVVRPGDQVWHLGDFAYRCPPQRAKAIFDQLNGERHLILGNHDFKNNTRELGWASIHELTEVVVDGTTIVMCHYGLRVWRNMRRGALHFYGHSHGRLPGTTQSQDVGVDCFGYAPATLPQIRSRMAVNKPLVILDDADEPTGPTP
jgi:calcineurin-like phosphoesterase family protein